MESAQRVLAPGETVTARGEQWRVSHAEQFPGCVLVTLDGVEHANAGVRFTLIAPFDTIATVALKKPRRRKRDSTLRAALAAIAGARPARGMWTVAKARVDLLAYQLEPALAVLGGATRVLLADGVGLGKTIQAGLILCELRARGLVDRALILTPAGLRDAWAAELRERFGLQPAVFDQSAIANQLPGLPVGFNPWMAHAIVIASIDLVKRPEVLAAVEQAPFDLLIADEAHHLTPGSDRGSAVDRLASRTPWVVLASATPHSGDQAAFDYLTRLGECGDRIAIFRRTRADVGLGSGRRVHLLPVTPSSLEMRMLSGVESYARAIWLGRGRHDRGARLVAILVARRAASSAMALERTLTRRLHLISGRHDPAPAQQALPWDDADEADGDAPAELLGLAGLDDGAREIRLLEDLIAVAAAARSSPTKIIRVARLIDRVREPVLVFTEYRDTLDALTEALCGTRKIGALHGGLPAAMRARIVREFNHGGLDLLIATDTAGEGLNLHHRCRLVIDVELPWNPVRLEQRIGRVDRLGQQRRVHAIRLLHRGTVEDTVLAHLERRRLRAGAALNLTTEEWLNEDDIAAAALGLVEPPQRIRPLLTSVTVGAAGAEAQRLVRQRDVASRCGARPDRALWSPTRHRFNASAEMVVLYTLQQPGSQGRIAGAACRALLIQMRGGPATRRDWQAWVNQLDEQLESLIATASISYARDVAAQLDPLRVSAGGRIDTARDRLRRSWLSELQASLFDGRAERLAAARQQALDRLDAALLRRALSLTPALPGVAARPRLIAVWPLER
ncbi:MAG: helicase-related protein [Acidobacteriota bacterium]|nr:helicase-related protein [Acidobacteriota bacterium]